MHSNINILQNYTSIEEKSQFKGFSVSVEGLLCVQVCVTDFSKQGPHYHNYRDRHGNTMVMVAVSSNSRYEVLAFLLKV